MLAPVIRLNGLTLRSDKPIPEAIQAFLLEQGIIASKFEYNGDDFVCLKGTYKVSQETIDAFVSKNKDLIERQQHDLDLEKMLSTEIIYGIINNIAAVSRGEKIEMIHEGVSYTFGGGGIIMAKHLKVNAGKYIMNTGSFFARRDIDMIAGQEIVHKGPSNGTIGFFAVSRAANNLTQIGGSILENALADAGNALIFSGRNTRLSLDPKISWGNNPHPDLLENKPLLRPAK